MLAHNLNDENVFRLWIGYQPVPAEPLFSPIAQFYKGVEQALASILSTAQVRTDPTVS
jgi:hypothetical protein